MTRREFLAKSAGATAVTVIGTGSSDVTANVVASPATPARLEGIWPYCVWWCLHRQVSTPNWWLAAQFRGVPLKTFKHFDGNLGDDQVLTVPFPGDDARVVRPLGCAYSCRVIEGRVDAMFRGREWPLVSVSPLLIEVDLTVSYVKLL